jgi:hypothetical protein
MSGGSLASSLPASRCAIAAAATPSPADAMDSEWEEATR